MQKGDIRHICIRVRPPYPPIGQCPGTHCQRCHTGQNSSNMLDFLFYCARRSIAVLHSVTDVKDQKAALTVYQQGPNYLQFGLNSCRLA